MKAKTTHRLESPVMTKQTVYQPHYFCTQQEYDQTREDIINEGGNVEYVMYDLHNTFVDVGYVYQGVAFINKDNKFKPLQ